MAAQGALGQPPAFSGVFISLVGFGFLGGISGVMMGTEQLNLLITTPSTCRATSTPPW